MNLQTFKAATMAIALQQVKAAMGADAVILHTRTYQTREWMGLKRREVVEVTAGRGLAGAVNRRRPPVQPPAAQQPPSAPGRSPGDSMFDILNQAAKAGAFQAPKPKGSPGDSVGGLALYSASATNPVPAPPFVPVPPKSDPKADLVANRDAIMQTPAAGNIVVSRLADEMTDLKKQMVALVRENRMAATPHVPDQLFDYYQNLIENRVAAELAIDIVRCLQRDLRPDQLAQPHLVRERLAEHIERLVPSCPPVCCKPKGQGPHVLALVGQTGVGKTTTLAKLAANLKLKDKHKVGLITLDTYRIAAVDQLRRYAEIIDSPLKVVSTADELRAAVAGLSHMDFILIDTAGRSPRDAAKLDELRDVLAAVQPDDVHLVLSSTSSQDAVELACTKFASVRVDKIIFTKLDEASHVGVVLNVCQKVNKALSYVTTGQGVPNDIEVGPGRLLARMILHGTDVALTPAVVTPVLAAVAVA